MGLRMSSLYLQNANGPSAEAMLSFSDAVILLILPIAAGVLLFLLSLIPKLFTHRLLIEHQTLEFTWTLLPALSLILLSLPSLSLLYLLDEVGFPSVTTKAQGHQWYWLYTTSDLTSISYESYPTSGPPRLLSADSSLVLPSCSVLRLLGTAADVLHSGTSPS